MLKAFFNMCSDRNENKRDERDEFAEKIRNGKERHRGENEKIELNKYKREMGKENTRQ